MENPTVARTVEWYGVAHDGLRSLQIHIGSNTHRAQLVSEETWQEVRGMSVDMFIAFLRAKEQGVLPRFHGRFEKG